MSAVIGDSPLFLLEYALRLLAQLLEQASAETDVLDVETHRAPIDEVVADLYEHWLGRSLPGTMATPETLASGVDTD